VSCRYNNFLCRGSLRPENYFKGSSRVKRLRKAAFDYPDIKVKHGFIWAVTSIAVTLCTDVFVYKMGSCNKTLFHKKVL
jgi:hypothetical protein